MRFAIGAMSAGDVLDRGLKLLLARLPTFYAINLIALAPAILFQLAIPLLVIAPAGAGEGAMDFFASEGGMAVMALALLAGLVLMLILGQIGNAAVLHVIIEEYVDRKVTIGQAFAFAFRRFEYHTPTPTSTRSMVKPTTTAITPHGEGSRKSASRSAMTNSMSPA